MLMEQDWRYRMTSFDEQVFDKFLPAVHPLLSALESIEWEQFTAILKKYYCVERGQPAIKPLVILKIELLRYMYRLSDRDAISRCETDILFRYFLQVPFTFQIPDSSLLAKFRGRLGADGFKSVFDCLVASARKSGLVQDRLRLKDATHIIANIAPPTAMTLLSQIRDRMIKSLEKFDAEMSCGFRIATEQMREQSKSMNNDDRTQARLSLVKDVLEGIKQLPLPSQADTNRAWLELQELRQLAEKIVLEQTDPDQNRRTVSVVDADARRGKHGDWYDGYTMDMLMDADSGIITQVDVLEAGGDEAKNAIALLQSEQEAHQNKIEQLSIDGAGFNGAMLHEIEDPEGLNIKVFVPPKAQPDNGLFPSSDFILSDDEQSVTCPAGQTSSYKQKNARDNGMIYRFKRSQCDGCPLLDRCNPNPNKGLFGRSVSKNKYQRDYDRARERAKTTEYAEIRRRHPAVERKLNDVMNYCGGRFAKYWGLKKVRIQGIMSCMASNVKQITKLTVKVRAAIA